VHRQLGRQRLLEARDVPLLLDQPGGTCALTMSSTVPSRIERRVSVMSVLSSSSLRWW